MRDLVEARRCVDAEAEHPGGDHVPARFALRNIGDGVDLPEEQAPARECLLRAPEGKQVRDLDPLDSCRHRDARHALEDRLQALCLVAAADEGRDASAMSDEERLRQEHRSHVRVHDDRRHIILDQGSDAILGMRNEPVPTSAVRAASTAANAVGA